MLRKIKEKIILRHLKSYFIETVGFNPYAESEWHEFYVLFRDGKYDMCYNKGDLIDLIDNRHQDIRYIFDATDKIILEKDIDIKIEETKDDKSACNK